MPEMPKMEKVPEKEVMSEKKTRFAIMRKKAEEKLAKLEKGGADHFSVDIFKVISNLLGRRDKAGKPIDASESEHLREDLKKQHPEYSTEIDALFVLFHSEIFNIKHLSTEWLVRATEVVYQSKNSIRIRNFWDRFRAIREIFGKKFVKAEKMGVTAQASAMHLLNRLGFETSIASPEEDAFESTDLWIWMPTSQVGGEEDFPVVETGLPIQVKSSKKVEKINKIRTTLSDTVHYPSAQISSGKLPRDESVFVSSEQFNNTPHLAERVETKEKRTGKKIYALNMEIPFNKDFINLNSGVPTQKGVESARQAIERTKKVLKIWKTFGI